MKLLTSIAVAVSLVLAAIGTFFAFCLIKAMTIAWTIFLFIFTSMLALFFIIAIPLHEYFTKRGSK